MFLAGRRSGWTQQSVSCSHLALAWLARRAGTLEWPRQSFSLLLTGSGDVSSRISAPACERWPGRVVYSTTAPSHDPGTRLVLAYRGGGLRRPWEGMARYCIGSMIVANVVPRPPRTEMVKQKRSRVKGPRKMSHAARRTNYHYSKYIRVVPDTRSLPNPRAEAPGK